MSKGLAVALSALALVAIALSAWYWAERESAEDTTGMGPQPAVAVTPRDGTGKAGEPQRLPSRDIPLRDALPQLRQLANEGNSQAACRLAAENQRCSGLALSEQEHDRWLASRRRGLDALAVSADAEQLAGFSSVFEAELAQRESRLQQWRAHCDGIKPPNALGQVNEWRQAALMGDPTAVRYYASGSIFNRSNFVDTAAAIQSYRLEAEAMAIDLARQGDLEMILVLAASYSPNPAQFKPLLAQVVEPDAAMSWALYQRAINALGVRKDNEALTLAATTRFQLELLEQGASPEQKASFASAAAQLDASWRPARANFRRYVSAEGEVPAARSADCDR